jgi:tetratricopeptide (TPR) repeat protein
MKEEGRTGEVIQECLKALAIHPEDIRLRMLLAESYLKTGFIGLAEAELATMTSEINDLSSAYKLQAQVYAQQNRFEAAMVSLKRYLALNPDDQEGLALLEELKPAKEETLEEEPVSEAVASDAEVESVMMPAEPEPVEEPVAETPEVEKAEPALVMEPEETFEEDIQATAAAEEPEESVVDLATPTLAELYLSQGEIHEAINTYEKVLLNNPDDQASEIRLAELKASVAREEELSPTEEDITRAKTEKTITILENWLNRIKTKDQDRIPSTY